MRELFGFEISDLKFAISRMILPFLCVLCVPLPFSASLRFHSQSAFIRVHLWFRFLVSYFAATSSLAAVAALLLNVLTVQARSSDSVIRDEWVDSDTGHRVVRLSRIPGESESFYFHQNAFTATGDKMVFANTSTNHSRNFFVYDWRTRKIDQLTESGTNRGEIVAPKSRQLYYMRDSVVYSTHLDTRVTKTIAELPRGWRGVTINADESLLGGAFGQGAAEISRGQPRSYWFKAIHDAKLPHLLFTLEIATGKTNLIHRGNDWFNHVQFSPTDSSLLMFCHEGPWHLVDRIWNIRTDGSGLRLIHERSVTNEIAGHEFWSADGKTVWFDLQIPRGEKFYLAGVAADVRRLSSNSPQKDESLLTSAATKEIRFPIERDQWSVHFNISHDGKVFAGDGGAPNMVAHATNGKWLWLFTPQSNGTLKAEHLVNMSRHDYSLEPNVNFTPDGKWLVFRGNFDGSAQVYAVEVAKSVDVAKNPKSE
jgi:oligogalacturonide lyase